MSIASFTEVLTALNLMDTRTAQQEALARLVHYPCEQAVKDYIAYDPEQAARTEFYPTRSDLGGTAEMHSDGEECIHHITSTQVHWWWERDIPFAHLLCLKHIPIRSIASIYEDPDGQAGHGTGKFPVTTLLTANEDWWIDLDEAGFGRSGFVFRDGAWSTVERGIKVTYTAGYTSNEFMTIAGPIKLAVLETIVRAFKAFVLQGALGGGTFTGGPLMSETLGDYKYTLGDGTNSDLSSFALDPVASIPDLSKERLEPYIHYGRKVII